MGNIFEVNSFQVPNALVDELIATLSGNELKCYLIIVRKTKGWQKEEDAISISQFMKLTKLSNRVVIQCCKNLEEKGLIESKKGFRNTTIYMCKKVTCDEKSLVTNSHSTCDEKSQVTYDEKSHTKNNIKNNNTKDNKLDFDLVMDAFNDAVQDKLPTIKKLTTARKNAIKKLINEFEEPTFQSLANYFYDFVDNAKPFHFGENDRNWKADFDYIVRPSTYLKVLEGSL
ncbi:replication protein [Orbaceae bacterium ac157xtp]